MSPTKTSTPQDPDTRKTERVIPADFAEYVTAIATGLGDGWTVATDGDSRPDLTAYLAHPDGRRIGIKRLWRGEAVQTWALAVPPREFDNEGDAASYTDSLKHLTNGIRYNVGVCFTNNPPAATTARNIRTRLLPAFDGKRPPLRAFPKKRPRPTSAKKAATPTTSTKAADASKPPAKGQKRKTAPARKTEPKKSATAARPRRGTKPAAGTAKPRDTAP
ncbi:hypothetical protein [Streptomyces sp. NBC_00286]|uniref:hypothetical protein n=1 Tax=Streptomyces sp. NBC_00286 TaxID=2975701 RepID=UPI002E2D5795|nr:hypothetical protein [Streptomyces sp. NBC_00286]